MVIKHTRIDGFEWEVLLNGHPDHQPDHSPLDFFLLGYWERKVFPTQLISIKHDHCFHKLFNSGIGEIFVYGKYLTKT